MLGLFLIFWGLLLLLSLATFDLRDPSLNHVVSNPTEIRNGAGLFGSYLGGMLADAFGIAAFLWPVGFIGLGARYIIVSFDIAWWRWAGLLALSLCMVTAGAAWELSLGDVNAGGVLGDLLYRFSWKALSPRGSTLVWLFLCIIGLQLTFDISWTALFRRIVDKVRADLEAHPVSRPQLPELKLPRLGLPSGLHLPGRKGAEGNAPATLAVVDVTPDGSDSTNGAPSVVAREASTPGGMPVETDDFVLSEDRLQPPASELPFEVVLDADTDGVADLTADVESDISEGAGRPKAKMRRKSQLPPLDLLHSALNEDSRPDREVLEGKGLSLTNCLSDFGVQGELTRITPGPVVTMFEFRPAPGVKVSRIANLSDDLALALKAIAVRIQAPIPGTDTVGIEIPNETRETVCFKELLSSDTFKGASSLLTLAIGKDIAGRPTVADLSKMPHLLVAGATGAGKSVCLNSILLSILYKARPEDVKLLLVDPKRIELAVYADLPHLVHPVVTEMAHAKNALDWAVHEMDKRYEGMARLGVRNIAGYNQKLEDMGKERPADLADLEAMPYLVIIIDELADLMLTAAKEVETSIVRLAQLARAAGIHLILATQRPSVDVVTGLIKANFPCRISFQVTSKHDSRTILDTVGAEFLLGKGDMLFKPSGGKLQRLHGAFVSDDDVNGVVAFWKKQQPPSYKVDFAEWGNEGTLDGNGGSGGAGDLADDPVYAEAVEFVMGQGRASISLIQRRFRIGFNKAARYVEQMEQDGIIGPADGSKPRSVIRGKE